MHLFPPRLLLDAEFASEDDFSYRRIDLVREEQPFGDLRIAEGSEGAGFLTEPYLDVYVEYFGLDFAAQNIELPSVIVDVNLLCTDALVADGAFDGIPENDIEDHIFLGWN